MSKLKQYLDEEAVQIALIAELLLILIGLFLFDKFRLLGTIDFILTIVIFGIVLGILSHTIGKENLTLFKLFLIGFLGLIIYEQGVVVLEIINKIPFQDTFLIGIWMGLITMIVGRLKGVKR